MSGPRLSVDRFTVTAHRMLLEPELTDMRDWLRRHGIDPASVCVPGWVDRDEDGRRVIYLDYERNDEGRVVFDKAKNDVRTVERYVQLEAPPLPWPHSLWIHVKPPEDA